jgi:hypothetical protein
LNFSCCFFISNDLNSNRTWKVFVCIANINFFVDKILVLMIKLTYACEAMFSMFSSRTKSFSMFILFAVFELKKIDCSFLLKTKRMTIRRFFFDSQSNLIQHYMLERKHNSLSICLHHL